MIPFLRHVAEDLFAKYGNNLADIALVFPNKRAGLFFNEYLVSLSNEPIWCPAYMTINELFQENSENIEADPILLVSKLHKIYCKHTGSNESLDKFYYWGELLIKDFDDIDKNMANVEKLFTNLKELRSFGNLSETLNEEQKDAIRRFFNNFKPEEESNIKKRFLDLWKVLLPIYLDFRRTLRNEKTAYGGMLCRDVIENDEQLVFPYSKYVFVGFNALNRVEDSMFKILQKKGKALFYWDYDTSYITNIRHEAGRFMLENLKQYPNELQKDIYTNLFKEKNITFVSASTENIQTRYLSDWLEKNVHGNEIETAVILCDEGLLEQVLHTIPPSVENINVTMGYPIIHTPAYSFMRRLIDLQIKGYDETQNRFRYETVHAMLKHTYTLQCSDNAATIDMEITAARDFFPSLKRLQVDDFLKKIFTHATDNETWIENIRDIIYAVSINIRNKEQYNDAYEELFSEALFCVYTQIQRISSLLKTGEIQLHLTTLASLLMRIIGSLTLPFHGEPVVGLQIMGLLETRNLDFKNIIMLSANENNLPQNNNDNSFIPYNLRRAFGLMLSEHRNSIYAYNFYRLIQRSENITMVYNCSEDGAGQGERSRYMLQMQSERKEEINEIYLKACHENNVEQPFAVNKTPRIMERLRNIFDFSKNKDALILSPSGINRYLDCPLKFFYYYISDLKVTQEIAETIQAADFGNIFHRSAELLYKKITEDGNVNIVKSQLEPYIKKTALLYPFIDRAFKECFFKNDESEKPQYDGLQFINREVLHRFLVRLVKMDAEYAPFRYVGSEKGATFPIEINTVEGEKIKLKIGGRVDRMDVKNNTLNIIDYKTGGKPEFPENIEELFDRNGKRYGYILQAMLYCCAALVSKMTEKVSPSLVYIHKQAEAIRENYIIKIKKEPVTDFSLYYEQFISCLDKLLCEIFDINVPFSPTEKKERCAFCDYRQLCGRTE